MEDSREIAYQQMRGYSDFSDSEVYPDHGEHASDNLDPIWSSWWLFYFLYLSNEAFWWKLIPWDPFAADLIIFDFLEVSLLIDMDNYE